MLTTHLTHEYRSAVIKHIRIVGVKLRSIATPADCLSDTEDKSAHHRLKILQAGSGSADQASSTAMSSYMRLLRVPQTLRLWASHRTYCNILDSRGSIATLQADHHTTQTHTVFNTFSCTVLPRSLDIYQQTDFAPRAYCP